MDRTKRGQANFVKDMSTQTPPTQTAYNGLRERQHLRVSIAAPNPQGTRGTRHPRPPNVSCCAYGRDAEHRDSIILQVKITNSKQTPARAADSNALAESVPPLLIPPSKRDATQSSYSDLCSQALGKVKSKVKVFRPLSPPSPTQSCLD